MILKRFRLLSWNIGQGGAKRSAAIVDALVRHNPDVIFLQEYRIASVPAIVRPLKEHGWSHVANNLTRPNISSLCVLSRTKLKPLVTPLDCPDPRRWLMLQIEGIQGTFTNLHIPPTGKGSLKKPFWDCILKHAQAQLKSPSMFVGTLNTGLPRIDEEGRSFVCSASFRQLGELGYSDLWRNFHGAKREYSWYSHYGNGFRVHNAFGSPEMSKRVARCDFDHSPHETGSSSHSMLIIDLH